MHSQIREKQIEHAREIWKNGFVANSIHNFCKNNYFLDTTMKKNNGLLEIDDLANWSASEEKPVSYNYNNYTIYKTDFWGQGPCFLQQLAILKNFNLEDYDYLSPEFVHLIVESTKLAFADRGIFLRRSNFVNVPKEILLSKEYNKIRSEKITSQPPWMFRQD